MAHSVAHFVVAASIHYKIVLLMKYIFHSSDIGFLYSCQFINTKNVTQNAFDIMIVCITFFVMHYNTYNTHV